MGAGGRARHAHAGPANARRPPGQSRRAAQRVRVRQHGPAQAHSNHVPLFPSSTVSHPGDVRTGGTRPGAFLDTTCPTLGEKTVT